MTREWIDFLPPTGKLPMRSFVGLWPGVLGSKGTGGRTDKVPCLSMLMWRHSQYVPVLRPGILTTLSARMHTLQHNHRFYDTVAELKYISFIKVLAAIECFATWNVVENL